MPVVNLNARNVGRLGAKDAARGEYWDRSLPGFGLRVTTTGRRTWTVRYRHKGRLHRLTIGRYPKLSLADAREKARPALHRAGLGEDPAGDKLAARDRYGDTVAALVDLFEKHSSKKRSWPEQRRILHTEVVPAWRHRLVSEITRRDVRALVDAKALTAPIMANRLLSWVSRLFNFALEREWIDANPAHRMKPPSVEGSRNRLLTSEELRELWPAIHETSATDEAGEPVARLSATMNDAFVVLLLTAQRCGEVCRMRWTDVNLEAGWWTIPGADAKNGTEHRVPLTDRVVDLIAGRLQVAKPDAAFVFANGNKGSVAARAKKAASQLSKGLTFSFRAHDLRRTAASRMAEAGVPREHIAHVLNHRSVTHSSITAIYDRYSYDREKRAALEAWSRSVDRVASAKRGGTVVPIAAGWS